MVHMVRGPSGHMLNPDMMVNRIAPQLPVSAMRSFEVFSPLETHTRKARCEEVECQHNGRGWITKIDVVMPEGQMRANYIRLHSGRSFTFTEEGTLITFTFPAGQQCFSDHRVSLERPAIFVVRDGDWRGNPTGFRRALRDDDWVDTFANHQIQLAEAQNRG